MSTFHRKPARTYVMYPKVRGKKKPSYEYLGVRVVAGQSNYVPNGPRELISNAINFQIPKKWGIQEGAMVDIIVEILSEGKAHPRAYYRYPEFGPFTNSKDLERLAIRLEWQSNGLFFTAYLEPTRLFTTPKDPSKIAAKKSRSFHWGFKETPHLTRPILIVNSLLADLLKYDYLPTRPAWMSLPANLLIRKVAYNLLQQRLDFSTPKKVKVNAPTLRSNVLDVVKLLAGKYGFGNLQIGRFAPDTFKLSAPPGSAHQNTVGLRTRCDMCMVVR